MKTQSIVLDRFSSRLSKPVKVIITFLLKNSMLGLFDLIDTLTLLPFGRTGMY